MQRALDFLQAHNEVALATVCNNKPELRVFSLSAAKGQSVNRFFFLFAFPPERSPDGTCR